MRPAFVRLSLVLVVTLGLAVVAVACGGGSDSLTLEEYFEELVAIDTEFSERAEELDAGLSETEDLDVIREALDDFLAVLDDFIAELEGLEPPDEAQEAHDEAVQAAQDFRDELDTVVESTEGAEDADAFFESASSEELTTASQAFTDTCLALEGLATETDITADLDCDEAE
jgi:hypothetical protein